MTFLKQAYWYDLPQELIATHPLTQRADSRMLVVDPITKKLIDEQFCAFSNYINPADLLVFNDSKVIPARLFGHKLTGGKVEFLLERVLSDAQAWSFIKSSKAPRVGDTLQIEEVKITVLERKADLFLLKFHCDSLNDVLEQHGQVPIPPYLKRHQEQIDQSRYQTVYAEHPGAVAAPTAGLHFDQATLAQLSIQGVYQAKVTLHVGAGTFQSVREDDVRNHQMHHEWLEVNQATIDAINACHTRGGRVIAIGTTTLRALETMAQTIPFKAIRQETNLMILPGYQFRCVDALLTNFHLPESTLLMLVAAMISKPTMMLAYQYAIKKQYRFFSYGDAMLITRCLTTKS